MNISPRGTCSSAAVFGFLAISMGACSPSNDASTGPIEIGGSGAGNLGGSASTGGATGTGISPSTGGAPIASGSSSAIGGAVSTGGARTGGAAATGGTPPIGGARSTGGIPATGGALALAGNVATGGILGTGGGPTTGGTKAAGGVASTGGSKSTGGVASTGGSKSTGGAANTGGLVSTGGSKATGTGGATSSCTPSTTKFSFFVTSQARLMALAQSFNGSTKGWGGDLRYGETGAGAGLRGADKICTAIAQTSMPGNCKTWRAFLSVADGGNGTQVNAISRIGSGPWYDRIGRLFGNTLTDITNTRPTAANTAIINDFPNEDGTLNHDALQTGSIANQDNHDMLTGSTTTGTLYSGTTANCLDWTSSAADTSKKPRVGHSWPAMSGQSWMSALNESGCAPGFNLVESGGPGNDGTVGSGGGYGGFYCFALTP